MVPVTRENSFNHLH